MFKCTACHPLRVSDNLLRQVQSLTKRPIASGARQRPREALLLRAFHL